jgi:uncharacterized membrane protein
MLCYVLGPISSMFMLHSRHYGDIWSVRFHAFHSMLMTGVWAMAWSAFRMIEGISPWFLATVTREFRFAMNLGFVAAWVLLLAAAYEGRRCAVIPPVHSLAVRLARRFQRALARPHTEAA